MLPFAVGFATLVLSAACLAAAVACSSLLRGTSIRVGASQDCPVLRKHVNAPSRTAASRSASSKIMLADFPPSSCVTRLTVGAAAVATAMRPRVEAVKENLAISGCDEIANPTVGPSPFTMLKTPCGTPASSRICDSRYAESGASSLGLSTTVQPAASAGATLQAIWFMGQFHGVIKPHTPTGSFRSSVGPLDSSNWKCPSTFTISAKCARPAGACAAFANHKGAPISSEMV